MEFSTVSFKRALLPRVRMLPACFLEEEDSDTLSPAVDAVLGWENEIFL
jgi:hypothetical protein